MPLLLDSLFSSVALGHLTVDMLNGSRAVILAYLSVPLGLSNTSIGIISTVYIWGSSLSQPVFGWVADRIGPRWLAAGGVLWMMSFFSLAVTLQGTLALILLVLASFGSAAFHPAGVMQATLRGRNHYAGRETTAASLFFMFGQLGLFFGPVLAGPLLDNFGLMGLLLPAGLALPVGLNAGYQLRNGHDPRHETALDESPVVLRLAVSRKFFIALALVAALQAWTQQNMITFVPKYLSDLGQTASTYGLIAGLFMGGSAFGNVIGGSLADRYGKRNVALTAYLLASIPLFIISHLGWSHWLYLLIPLSGALTGSVHSIIVVLAQRSIPGGMAMASGLALGFMFSAGALGTLLSGPLADAQGFPLVFRMTSGLVLVAAALVVLFLRGEIIQSSSN
jgi:FSR family fosmidomycin resistance protein-like MFS transporter